MNEENQWGPFALNLDPAERLRSLRTIVRLHLSPRGVDLAEFLRQAEADESALAPAANALDALAPLDMRKVLASYAGLARPLPPTDGVRIRQTMVPRTRAGSTQQAAA